jgi:nucleoside phosphorylase
MVDPQSVTPHASTAPRQAVVVAMQRELRLLRRVWLDGASGPALHLSGVGPARAAAMSAAAIRAGATGVASIGLAGALEDHLRCGDVLLPARIRQECQLFDVSAPWRARVASRIGAGVHGGELLTVTTVAAGADDKGELARRTGAIAVDMEAAAVASVCREHGVPFLAIKAIVDERAHSVPRALLRTLDEYGEPRLAALAWQGVRTPVLLPELLRLARATLRAEQALQTALCRLGADLAQADPLGETFPAGRH